MRVKIDFMEVLHQMSLQDLCNDFWDEIVSLMDYRVIIKIRQPKAGLSRIEAVRAYLFIDPDFLYTLGAYLHLAPAEIAREEGMLLKAS